MTEFPETRSSLLACVRSPDDAEAWETFVVLYRPTIYRMARRRGMQDADAQDLAQVVLGRVAGAIGRWERRDEHIRFRHWLRRVARNAILSALERAPRDAAAGGSGGWDPEGYPAKLGGPAASIEREIELEAMRERYLHAARIVRGDVDPATWTAFEATVVEGRPCAEVAASLDRSVGAIHAARSRVMRRLRDEVRALEGDEP